MPTIRELSTGKRDIWFLDPRTIKAKPGFNVRDEGPDLTAHIESLALSIISRGYDQAKPLTVFQEGDTFYVSDGHCRLRATMLAIKRGADIKSVPVLTEARGANEADRVIGLLTRNSGKNLTPLEQGRVYKRLQGFGWEDNRIADETGMSISHVKSIFALMEADPGTHNQIVNGDVSATVVAGAVKRHGASKAAAVVTAAVNEAKASGRTRATGRDVRGAASSEPTSKRRPLSEIVEFFRVTIAENDGPPSVQKIAKAFLDFQEGSTSPERFMKQLGAVVPEEQLAA